MTSRADLKTEILDDMDRGTADGPRALTAISAAIKFYQPKRFFFNESRSITFNTVAGTAEYAFGASAAITTEFYSLDGVFLTDGTDIRELDRNNYTVLERLAATSNNDTPTDYAYVNKALRFHPVPDAIYSVRLTGHVKLAEPALDADDGNDWFEEAYELIKCRSKAYLYAHVFEDVNMAQVMRAAESDALSALRSATSDKVAPGYLAATDF